MVRLPMSAGWAWIAALLCAIAAPALAAEGEPWTIEKTVPGTGETCFVCGERIYGEDVVHLRYRGREVTVGAPLYGEWKADPDRYFRRVQPRAALFDEEAMGGRSLASGWLLFGIYMLAGTLVGGATAYLAVARGLPPVPWFFLGVLFDVLAIAAVLTRRGDLSGLPQGVPGGLRKVPVTHAQQYCPACGAENHPSAARCGRCAAALAPSIEAETRRV